jgi:hypothetical protein
MVLELSFRVPANPCAALFSTPASDGSNCRGATFEPLLRFDGSTADTRFYKARDHIKGTPHNYKP